MGISSLEELSDLIARIYSCSLDPSLWHETLGDIVAAAGACCGQIGVQDPVRMKADFVVEWGIQPEYADLYAEKFIKICPFLLTPYFTDVDEVISLSEMIDRDEFRSSRFYREWCRPQSVEDFLAGIIMKSAAAYGGFSLSFPDIVDDPTRRLHRMLVPHVRRAVTIGRLLTEARSEARVSGAAIDALSAGAIFVDRTGQIVRTNPAAEAILAEGCVLRRGSDGRVVATYPPANENLRKILAAHSGSTNGAVREAGVSLALRRSDGSAGLIAHLISNLPGPQVADLAGNHDAAFVLFVQNPDVPLIVPGKAFVDLYGITPAELRVLLGLIKGQSAKEIASDHGIGLVTVRTHIHSLLVKTGTNRQSELVRRVAASAPALGVQSGPS